MHRLPLSLIVFTACCLAISSCDSDPINQQARIVAKPIQLISSSVPGEYSDFHFPTMYGGLWVANQNNQPSIQQAKWIGDSIETIIHGPFPGVDRLTLTGLNGGTLAYSSGTNGQDNLATIYADDQTTHSIRMCENSRGRCISSYFRETPAGIVIVALSGSSYPFQIELRWLGNGATEDVHIASLERPVDHSLLGVTSSGSQVFGTYIVDSAFRQRELVPFSFSIDNPASSFRTGQSITDFERPLTTVKGENLGIASGNEYCLFHFGDPLMVASWQGLNLVSIEREPQPRPTSYFRSAIGTYDQTYRANAEEIAFYIDENGGHDEELIQCSSNGGRQVIYVEGTQWIVGSEADPDGSPFLISTGIFKVFSIYDGEILGHSAKAIVSIDPQTQRITRAWTVQNPTATSINTQVSIWGVKQSNDSIFVMATRGVPGIGEEVLLGRVGLE